MTIVPTSPAQAVEAARLHFSQTDPILARIFTDVGTCTLELNTDLFGSLVETIVGQQISVQAADSIMKRLREAVNGSLTPEALILLDEQQLRAVGLSSMKVRYFQSLIEHLQTGALDLTTLPFDDDETAIQKLIAVKGIGRWTAECLLLFSLGRLDIFPADDLGLQDIVHLVYQLPARPTAKQLRVMSEQWRPYRSLAAWYLWRWRRISTQRGKLS